jgi:hypothetical protein
MMTDERGLRRLDAHGGERALLKGNQPCIEQQEIDRLAALDELGNGRLNTRRLVQIERQRRENAFVFSRELSGRLLGPGQAAPGDDDLALALFGKKAGGRLTEPGSGAGDESNRVFHGQLRKGKGRVVMAAC